KPPMIHPVMRRMVMLLVWKMVHGSLYRAVHGICILVSWSSPAGAKLSMLVLLYMQALCHLPCGPRWSHYVRTPMPKGLVFSPRGAEIRSHPGVAAQGAPLGGRGYDVGRSRHALFE